MSTSYSPKRTDGPRPDKATPGTYLMTYPNGSFLSLSIQGTGGDIITLRDPLSVQNLITALVTLTSPKGDPMSLIATKGNNTDFERVPEGVYIGRCFMLVDIGTQESAFKGETKFQKKIHIAWELLDEDTKMADGRPFAISKTYTNSLHEKSSLYADVNAWRGKKFTDEELEGFDLQKVVGAYCQLQVSHEESANGRTYANITSIMALPKGMNKPEAVNDTVTFDLDEKDADKFNALPDFLKRRITESMEWTDFDPAFKAKVTLPAPRTDMATIPTKQGDVLVAVQTIDLDEIPF